MKRASPEAIKKFSRIAKKHGAYKVKDWGMAAWPTGDIPQAFYADLKKAGLRATKPDQFHQVVVQAKKVRARIIKAQSDSRVFMQKVGNFMRPTIDKIQSLVEQPGQMTPQSRSKFLRRLDQEADKFIGEVTDLYKSFML